MGCQYFLLFPSVSLGLQISNPHFCIPETTHIHTQIMKNIRNSHLFMGKRYVLAYPEMGLIQLEGFRPFLGSPGLPWPSIWPLDPRKSQVGLSSAHNSHVPLFEKRLNKN
jgi:hypothetical protein